MWSLLLNKYVLGAIAAILLALGLAAGVDSVHNAYTQRAALQTQVKQQTATITADAKAIDGLKSVVATDQQDKQKLVDEIALRDKLASESAARNEQLTKDLKHANTTLANWKKSASSALQSCLNAPLPDGLFNNSGEASAAGDGDAGQVRPAAR